MNEKNYSEAQWQMLHDEIQKRLRAFAAQLQAVAPCLDPRFGKTVTKLFPLFSHVSFRLNHVDEIDIIVGADIAPHEGQWQIDADISEEESGKIYFELPRTPFSVSSFEELKDHVIRAVDQLIESGKPVLFRLFGSPMPVVPSQAASLLDVAPKG